MKITYPRTKYLYLNNYISLNIGKIINEFLEGGKVVAEPFFDYYLIINYDEFSYKNYLSYVFYVSIYTGGAHPDNRIFTINYDKLKNKIIKIDDIINNKALLDISRESRRQLLSDKNIGHDQNSLEMLTSGTTPNSENFKNFVFTDKGIVIYFEQYQVAPYAAGSFSVLIPYNLLSIK